MSWHYQTIEESEAHEHPGPQPYLKPCGSTASPAGGVEDGPEPERATSPRPASTTPATTSARQERP